LGEIIRKDKAKICNVVLLLARKVTRMGLVPSFSANNCLKEETTISLIIKKKKKRKKKKYGGKKKKKKKKKGKEKS